MGKILLVDDTRTMVEVLKVHLMGQGHDYVTATDGRHALEVVQREHPDLIISDVVMPNMSGLQFLRELRGTRGCSKTPVVLISSQWNSERRIEALRAGAAACLEKPLQVDWFTKVVNRLLGPAAP